ncbi:MAG TPA: SLBB domain-containing protein [Gemmatimonadales bacterium]|jgi:polysaccharide export outer membrane protein|nr:SLBB domain-containing protein [Gemmatimonadales bacterium]
MIEKLVVRLLALLLVAGPLAGQTAQGPPQGGFEVGDQILLEVEGDTQFTHAFSVGPGPALTLPVIGAIPLASVRRADVETYLTQQLGRYVKNPVVHAKVLVRLGVLGEVEHPGFYTVFSGAVVSDALMAAGGPTKDANFTGARIERDGKGIFVGNGFQDAFTRGLTIEGMGLRTGDRIVVPRRNDTERTVRMVGILVSIPIAVLGIRQLVR